MPREPVRPMDPNPDPWDRPLTPLDPIAPHQLWSRLTPTQQQHVRQTVVAICQQWLMTRLGGSAEERTHDDTARIDDADQNHCRASGT